MDCNMKKVVILGGGTGLSTLLKGLKKFPIDITAVVSVADDGTSTGRLRKEFSIPAVGDLRKVLGSLSNVSPQIEELLEYRFNTYSDLDGHALGNLMLTAMYNITGSLSTSIDSLSKIFNLKGKILPFSEDLATLIATTYEGETIIGQSNIHKAGKHIKNIKYQKKIKVNPEVIKAINSADLIIIGIGSLYTSIIPNLLSPDMKKALKNSKANKMYICNIMSERGETDGYNVSDCIKSINKYVCDDFIDVVLVNSQKVPQEILNLYNKEKSHQILLDEDNVKSMNVKLLTRELLYIKNNQVRHDYNKTALEVFNYLSKEG